MSIEKNIVHHGDNVDVMRSFPDKCIDLVVTSPPYDDLREYGGHGWDFEGLAGELNRCLKPGGVIVWVVADATINGSETGSSFRQALHFMEIGLRLHDTMIYKKQNPPPTGSYRYYSAFEYMFVLSKNKPKVFRPIKVKRIEKRGRVKSYNRNRDGDFNAKQVNPNGDVIKTNVWNYVVGGGISVPVGISHPAAFPVDLAKDHIYSWSNPGDVVLDPFAGSGTTLQAAKELGRDFIGIEIHEPYVNVCRERVAQEVLCFE